MRPTQGQDTEAVANDNTQSVRTFTEVEGNDDTLSSSTDGDNGAEDLEGGGTDGLLSDDSFAEDRTVTATPHTHSNLMKRSDGGTRKCTACVTVLCSDFIE